MEIKDRNGKVPNPNNKAFSIYYEDLPQLPIYFSTVDGKPVLKVKEYKIEFDVQDSETNLDKVFHYFFANKKEKEKIVEMVNTIAKRKGYQIFTEEEIYNDLNRIDIDLAKVKLKFDDVEYSKFIIDRIFIKKLMN